MAIDLIQSTITALQIIAIIGTIYIATKIIGKYIKTGVSMPYGHKKIKID